jgi:hypothetical protein
VFAKRWRLAHESRFRECLLPLYRPADHHRLGALSRHQDPAHACYGFVTKPDREPNLHIGLLRIRLERQPVRYQIFRVQQQF